MAAAEWWKAILSDIYIYVSSYRKYAVLSVFFFYKHCKKFNITGASHIHFLLQDKLWQFLNLRKMRPLLPVLDQSSSRAGFVPLPNLEPLSPVSTDKKVVPDY